jgi:hypothetical protein
VIVGHLGPGQRRDRSRSAGHLAADPDIGYDRAYVVERFVFGASSHEIRPAPWGLRPVRGMTVRHGMP